jgi:RNA polymerase sigma-70 factor (family 1)
LERLSTGDQDAFMQVYDQYRPYIYNITNKLLRSAETAEEVIQEVFMDLWRNRAQALQINNLKGYLFGMARNEIFDTLKKEARMAVAASEYAYQIDRSYEAGGAMLEKQYEELLKQSVDRLPPRQKQIFRMARIDGMSYEAIGRTLGITPATAKRQMATALQTLRQNLKPHLAELAFLAVTFQVIAG